MHIAPVAPTSPAAPAVQAVHAARAARSARVSTSEVSPAILQRATGDGDGRTGAGALNDGDAAALAAASQRINVRA
jgi:hypothetical protein